MTSASCCWFNFDLFQKMCSNCARACLYTTHTAGTASHPSSQRWMLWIIRRCACQKYIDALILYIQLYIAACVCVCLIYIDHHHRHVYFLFSLSTLFLYLASSFIICFRFRSHLSRRWFQPRYAITSMLLLLPLLLLLCIHDDDVTGARR